MKISGKSFLIVLLLFCALILVPSCSNSDSESEEDHSNVRNDDDDVNDDTSDDVAKDNRTIQIVNSSADWDCESECNCYQDYENFLTLAEPFGNPISEDELLEQFKEIDLGLIEPIQDSLPGNQLGKTIVEKMNIEFLQKDINKRKLDVLLTGEKETAQYIERSLLFVDPYVGKFKGILLLPKTEGPHPGVLALHGHYDNAELYMDNFHGKEYPEHGFAILMLTFRNMCVDENESLFTHDFLRAGFSAMGIRSYEALLGLKYLQSLPEINKNRIGLIGHSGGSTTGNLVVRFEKGFSAYVSDYSGTYFNMIGDLIIDETTPSLWPYHLLINNFSTSDTPILEVPYGYENQMEIIFDFFSKNLTHN